MHNPLEHSNNYSMTSGSLANYHRDAIIEDKNENNAGYMINNNKATTSKSIVYKTKTVRKTLCSNNTLKTKVVVPLRYLSFFWRSLEMSLINCGIELDLS